MATLFKNSADAKKTASHASQVKDFPSDVRIELLLPVNTLKSYEPSKSRVNIFVSIPQDFCSVYSLSDVMQSSMAEFIPKTDKDVNSWSEIITTNTYLGKSLKASQVTENIIQGLLTVLAFRILSF